MVLTNTGRGGSQAYVMTILRNIDKTLFDVDVVTSSNPPTGYGQEIEKLGIDLFVLPHFKVWNYYNYKKAWCSFFQTHHYDIVHAHATSAASIYLKIAKKFGCITIAHSHNSLYRGSLIEKKVKSLFVLGLKKQSDYWFSCSDKAAPRLFGKKYEDNPHYYELPNAIDVKQYLYNEKSREKIRKNLGLDMQVRLYGHVGTFSEPKNHKFLIDIFREICNRDDNSMLLLVGDGPLKQQVTDYIESSGINKKVIMTGNVTNVYDYLCAMDAMIFPSLFEGFPISLVEAQAAGLYSVISDVITRTVIQTDCIRQLSLNLNASMWAEIVMKNPIKDRVKYNIKLEQSKYNIHNSIQQLSLLYIEMKNTKFLYDSQL